MSEQSLTSVLSAIALISAIIGGVLYALSIFLAVKRILLHKKKSSGGIACVIIATIFAVTAILLYTGISIWWFIGIVVVDSVLITLMKE